MLFGTGALRRLYPGALRDYTHAAHDLDLLIQPQALVGFVHAAQRAGFVVQCWGEDWQPEWTAADVAGRWYVRATRSPFCIDATFECPFLDVAAAHRESIRLDGVLICPEVMIWRLKWIKDAEVCQAFADRYGLEIPAAAMV